MVKSPVYLTGLIVASLIVATVMALEVVDTIESKSAILGGYGRVRQASAHKKCPLSQRALFQLDDHRRLGGNNVHAATLAVKHDFAIDQSVKRVVITLTHTRSRVVLGANLTDEDISCPYGFATKLLDATALGIGVTSVSARTLPLLMCHFYYPISEISCELHDFAAI